VFIVFTQIYVYISSNNTSSVTLSKCTQVAFKHISKLVNSAIRMSINTTYNILKCNIFELFGYLYPYIFSCNIIIFHHVVFINLTTFPGIIYKYANSARLQMVCVIIKCIIIKQVMEKSQLNVGSHQHAQWQLVSITHC